MSELPSAMFSIADGNEFRFARFYIVCEAIRLEALESPLIVCACRTFPADCQNAARHGMECEMRRFSTLQVKELLVSGADVRRLDGIRHLAENAQQRLRA